MLHQIEISAKQKNWILSLTRSLSWKYWTKTQDSETHPYVILQILPVYFQLVQVLQQTLIQKRELKLKQ
jgi:hypothetical protein